MAVNCSNSVSESKKMGSPRKQTDSLAEAFFLSPGPRGMRETALLFGKGVCMGSADIVPGVSGGTIAFIVGIYAQLLEAISSINMRTVKDLLRGDLRAFLRDAHLRFLIVLLAGIGVAVVSLARVMYFLLQEHPVPTWGFFFGLIVASVLLLGREIKDWRSGGTVFFVLGAVGAYYLVALIPVTTPESAWFVFLSGAIAICAMILPGISGSFILLVLDKYHFITGAIRNPLEPENLLILSIFAAGCVVGILSFSRLLNFMMHRYHNITMSLLTGFIFGSLRKIWPWKEVLETVNIGGKLHVLRDRNILPPSYGGEFWFTCLLVVLGLLCVVVLHYVAGRRQAA